MTETYVEAVTPQTRLNELKAKVDAGKSPKVTVREFLNWFGYSRRGKWVVREIRKALRKAGLLTVPDFEWTYFDSTITFANVIPKMVDTEVPPELPGDGATETVPDEPETSGDAEPELVPSTAYRDPTYRIGKLPAASHELVSVKPDNDVTVAVTLMIKHGYSQLPVMTTERDARGLISWKSIAIQTRLGNPCQLVRECMVDPPDVVEDDTSLFKVLPRIVEDGCVLVRNAQKKITGIVTATDLSKTLDVLAQPFLLLSEIENQIRGLIDGRFTVDELQAIRKAEDTGREMNSVADLTFGEYVHLIQEPSRWDKLGFGTRPHDVCQRPGEGQRHPQRRDALRPERHHARRSGRTPQNRPVPGRGSVWLTTPRR